MGPTSKERGGKGGTEVEGKGRRELEGRKRERRGGERKGTRSPITHVWHSGLATGLRT